MVLKEIIYLRTRKEGLDNDCPFFIPHPIVKIPSKSKKSKKEDLTPIELKALDFLNILTRVHLKMLLKEYGLVSHRHNVDTNIKWNLISCKNLRRQNMSRFDLLKKGYFDLYKNKSKKGELIINMHENRSSMGDKSEFIPYGVLEKIKNLHIANIEEFIEMNNYTDVGFDKFRYDQCPKTSIPKTVIKTDRFSKSLQETWLSLKITKEGVIEEAPKEKDIHILSFALYQTEQVAAFHFNIPDIHNYVYTNRIVTKYLPRSLEVFVPNHKGKNYVFKISNFANKINPRSTDLQNFGENTLVIFARKNTYEQWIKLFNYDKEKKVVWEEQMRNILNTISPDVLEHMEPLNFIWKIALILVNCEVDLLNLPHDLNLVNKRFETLDEMIIYYKTMIRFNPHLKALFYILGGALYKKFIMNSSLISKKALSKCEKEIMAEITRNNQLCERNYIEGLRFCYKDQYEQAISSFSIASSSLTFPNLHIMRSTCLYQIERYKEAIMDSIFALRNLGPYQGFYAAFIILNYNIKRGNVLPAINVAISYEFNYKQKMEEHQTLAVKNLRRYGLEILKNVFKSYSLIFQKKYKDAIPFLEKAEHIIRIKSGHSSVILLLLYFINKDYEKVNILSKKILDHQSSFKDLVSYLLEMSSSYIKLDDANNNLEKQELCDSEELTKFEKLINLIRKADNLLISGTLTGVLIRSKSLKVDIITDCYSRTMELANDNDKVLAHIWTKLGVLKFFTENFEESVEFLTYSISLNGKNKNILFVRSEAYYQLDMTSEAEKDSDEAFELVIKEAEEKPI